MSEKGITASAHGSGESTHSAQKLLDRPHQDVIEDTARQDQMDAFRKEFADLDIDTDEIIADEAAKAEEHAQLNKLAELNAFLEDAEDRRRGLKAIYKSDLIDTMTDEEVEAFIGDKLGLTPPEIDDTPAEAGQETADILEQKDGPEILDTNDNLPTGFPTTEQALEDLKSEGPVKLGFWKRARLLAGAPGRMVWKGYSAMFDRAAKHSEKMRYLSENDPEKYEKYKKRSAILSTLGAAAVAGAMAAWKSEQLIHAFAGITGGNGHDINGHASAGGLGHNLEQQQAHIAEFKYDPAKDPLNQPGRHEFNFSAGVDTADPAKAKAQLLENWKHNPQQFATVLASAGVIKNNPDAINHLADQMSSDPSVYAQQYDKFVASLGPNAHFRPGQEGYGSFSTVDNGNGTQTVTYQDTVYGDNQPVVVLMANGQPICIGGHCGQPVFLKNIPQQTTTAPVYTTAQGNGGYTPQQHKTQNVIYTQPQKNVSQGGGNYTPPTHHKQTPPSTPQTPKTPTTPVTPPEKLTPKDPSKDWQKNPNISDWKKDQGALFGSGEKKSATPPPATYTPPASHPNNTPSTNLAPNKTPNTGTDPHANGGNIPKATPNVSGDGTGNGSTTGGDSGPRSNGTVSE